MTTKKKLDNQSQLTENYLLALYNLREERVPASSTRLAEYIRSFPESEGVGTTLPSVLGMLKRMQKEGLVSSTPTRDFVLSQKGIVLAEDVVRRPSLAECMVVSLLGVKLERAHVEAHSLEHAISDELQNDIEKKLNKPTISPYGRPIPGTGEVLNPNTLTLDQVKLGEQYFVDRIPETDQELLSFLVLQGILPGKEITVTEAALYQGVGTIMISNKPLVIGSQVASRIWVRTEG